MEGGAVGLTSLFPHGPTFAELVGFGDTEELLVRLDPSDGKFPHICDKNVVSHINIRYK